MSPGTSEASGLAAISVPGAHFVSVVLQSQMAFSDWR